MYSASVCHNEIRAFVSYQWDGVLRQDPSQGVHSNSPASFLSLSILQPNVQQFLLNLVNHVLPRLAAFTVLADQLQHPVVSFIHRAYEYSINFVTAQGFKTQESF